MVQFYTNRDNKRGTAGQQAFKGGKEAVKLTRLSCHRFRANEVRRRLSVIVYDPGNVWRRLAAERMRAGAR